MKTTDYAGIDYSLGKVNRDLDNGIHYGVIHHASVGQAWYDESEPYYGEGSQCQEVSDEVKNDPLYLFLNGEPVSHYIDNDEVRAEQGSDSPDIFITKSEFYTRAQYCSPCCPGAGNLDVYCPTGPKTYCFGHDWFEGGVAPYPVYRVDNDELVQPEQGGDV